MTERSELRRPGMSHHDTKRILKDIFEFEIKKSSTFQELISKDLILSSQYNHGFSRLS
jgi:hypothetical protein